MLLGGILTSGLSWRWVLFVNVPIGLIAAALAPRLLLESRAEDGTKGFDLPGAVTVTAGLALLVYAVVDAVNVGWGSTATLSRLAGAAVLLAAFIAIELRQRHPLLPFSIFRLRTLRGANIVGLLIGMSLFTMFFFISLYLQDVLHYSPIKAGLSYLPLSLGIVLSAGAASQLVTRIGFKPTLIGGLLLIAAGLLWFSRVPAPGGSFTADVLGPSLLAAFGLGFSFVPVTIAAVTGTKPHEAGLASGLINTSQQVGGALGLAILATVANSRTQSLFHAGVDRQGVALTKGFDRAFLVGAGFAIVGAILTAILISSRDSREQAEAALRGEGGTLHARRGLTLHEAPTQGWLRQTTPIARIALTHNRASTNPTASRTTPSAHAPRAPSSGAARRAASSCTTEPSARRCSPLSETVRRRNSRTGVLRRRWAIVSMKQAIAASSTDARSCSALTQ